ncbi:hypothetical protein [Streptomyces sp. NPDC092903]
MDRSSLPAVVIVVEPGAVRVAQRRAMYRVVQNTTALRTRPSAPIWSYPN